MIYFKVPMLFYDCVRRTYQCTEWIDLHPQQKELGVNIANDIGNESDIALYNANANDDTATNCSTIDKNVDHENNSRCVDLYDGECRKKNKTSNLKVTNTPPTKAHNCTALTEQSNCNRNNELSFRFSRREEDVQKKCSGNHNPNDYDDNDDETEVLLGASHTEVSLTSFDGELFQPFDEISGDESKCHRWIVPRLSSGPDQISWRKVLENNSNKICTSNKNNNANNNNTKERAITLGLLEDISIPSPNETTKLRTQLHGMRNLDKEMDRRNKDGDNIYNKNNNKSKINNINNKNCISDENDNNSPLIFRLRSKIQTVPFVSLNIQWESFESLSYGDEVDHNDEEDSDKLNRHDNKIHVEECNDTSKLQEKHAMVNDRTQRTFVQGEKHANSQIVVKLEDMNVVTKSIKKNSNNIISSQDLGGKEKQRHQQGGKNFLQYYSVDKHSNNSDNSIDDVGSMNRHKCSIKSSRLVIPHKTKRFRFQEECLQSEPVPLQHHSMLRIPVPSNITFPTKQQSTIVEASFNQSISTNGITIYAQRYPVESIIREERHGSYCSSPFYSSLNGDDGHIKNELRGNYDKDIAGHINTDVDGSQFDDEMNDIFDPTDPPVHGTLNAFMYENVQSAADRFYCLLMMLSTTSKKDGDELIEIPKNDSENIYPLLNFMVHDDLSSRCTAATAVVVEDSVCAFIESNPVTCQVKYKLPGFLCPCYPLSYFASIGFIRGIKLSYQAFPEAIGYCDKFIGSPLHYAVSSRQPKEVIECLLKLFPESVRLLNYSEKRSPLHMACCCRCSNSYNNNADRHKVEKVKDNCMTYNDNKCKKLSSKVDLFPDRQVIELLLNCYYSSVQIPDNVNGMTPLHYVCQWGCYYDDYDDSDLNDFELHRYVLESDFLPHVQQVSVLKMFIDTSPMAIHAVTADMQKPLHIAAQCGASTKTLALILQHDPSQIRFTDDMFQTPLHKAVQAVAAAGAKKSLLGSGKETNDEKHDKMLDSSHKNNHIRALQVCKSNIAFLVQSWPEATRLMDVNDQTPFLLAKMLGCTNDVLELLQ